MGARAACGERTTRRLHPSLSARHTQSSGTSTRDRLKRKLAHLHDRDSQGGDVLDRRRGRFIGHHHHIDDVGAQKDSRRDSQLANAEESALARLSVTRLRLGLDEPVLVQEKVVTALLRNVLDLLLLLPLVQELDRFFGHVATVQSGPFVADI